MSELGYAPDADPDEELRELKLVLHRIVQRLTRQIFTTPLQTQIDVGQAIAITNRASFPKQSLVSRTLVDLLREAGKKRPDVYRHVLVLEDAVRDLEDRTRPFS